MSWQLTRFSSFVSYAVLPCSPCHASSRVSQSSRTALVTILSPWLAVSLPLHMLLPLLRKFSLLLPPVLVWSNQLWFSTTIGKAFFLEFLKEDAPSECLLENSLLYVACPVLTLRRQRLFCLLNSKATLSDIVAVSHIWLFKFKQIKTKKNWKFSSSVTLDVFLVLKSHMWPAGTVLDSSEYLHHQRRFYKTGLLSGLWSLGFLHPLLSAKREASCLWPSLGLVV